MHSAVSVNIIKYSLTFLFVIEFRYFSISFYCFLGDTGVYTIDVVWSEIQFAVSWESQHEHSHHWFSNTLTDVSSEYLVLHQGTVYVSLFSPMAGLTMYWNCYNEWYI